MTASHMAAQSDSKHSENFPAVRPLSQQSQRRTIHSNQEATERADQHATAMPPSFYHSVDALLSHPSPDLRAICKKGDAVNPAATLPALRKKRSELRKLGSGAIAAVASMSLKRDAPFQSKKQEQPPADINLARVVEAMQYCDHLTRAALSQGTGSERSESSRTAPLEPSHGRNPCQPLPSGKKKGKSKTPVRTRAAEDRMHWPYAKHQDRRDEPGLCSSKETAVGVSKCVAPEEIVRLVHNFESGAHLRELRKQLHESQKSMEESKEFIAAAALSWHQPRVT